MSTPPVGSSSSPRTPRALSRRIRRAIVAIAAATLVGVLGIVAFVTHSDRLIDATERQEARASSALTLRLCMENLLDMETGQRGYLLTAEAANLEPYERGWRSFWLNLKEARALTADDAGQQQRLERVGLLAHAKQAEFERTIALRRDGLFVDALDTAKSGEGKPLMDDLRRLLGEAVAVEHHERARMANHARTALQDAKVVFLCMILAIGVMVAAAYRALYSVLRATQLESQRNEQRALRDPLTQLPNRRLFERTLEQRLADAQDRGTHVSLLYMDLDGFKAVNDRLGHEAGDRVLKEAGVRVQASLRDSDLVARFGGDEFVAVLADDHDSSRAHAVADRILAAFQPALLPELGPSEVDVSIGTASTTDGAWSAHDLLAAADEAMYRTKRAKRG